MVENPNLPPGELAFHYEKSSLFRVVHVDGAIGSLAGANPIGPLLHMAVYSERVPYPKMVVHHIRPDGVLEEEILDKRVSRSGVYREIEADLVMSLEVALAIRNWLDAQLRGYKDRLPGYEGFPA